MPASSRTLSEFIPKDLQAAFPLLMQDETDHHLLGFTQFVHNQILKRFDKNTHGEWLTFEQLKNLGRGLCVHQEVADNVTGLIAGIHGASFLDSCGQLQAGDGGQGFRLVQMNPSAAETLVLSTTYSELLRTKPHLLWQSSELQLHSMFTRFKTWIWTLIGNRHYTALRMNIADGVVEVQKADSNSLRPVLDRTLVANLGTVVRMLRRGTVLSVKKGLALPAQNSMNDCLFHVGLYVEAELLGTPLPVTQKQCQLDASRLRAYVTLLVYKQMKIKDSALQDLCEVFSEWAQHNLDQGTLVPPPVAPASTSSMPPATAGSGCGEEAAAVASSTATVAEGMAADENSEDLSSNSEEFNTLEEGQAAAALQRPLKSQRCCLFDLAGWQQWQARLSVEAIVKRQNTGEQAHHLLTHLRLECRVLKGSGISWAQVTVVVGRKPRSGRRHRIWRDLLPVGILRRPKCTRGTVLLGSDQPACCVWAAGGGAVEPGGASAGPAASSAGGRGGARGELGDCLPPPFTPSLRPRPLHCSGQQPVSS